MTRLCVYACYPRDAERPLPRYVVFTIHALKKCGYEVWLVINRPAFLVTSPSVHKDVSRIMWRENKGWDWAAWCHAFEKHGQAMTEQYDSVLFTNDSYAAPVFGTSELRKTLESMWSEDFDVWGMTNSHERVYHVQSYWLEYSKRVLQSETFKKRMCVRGVLQCRNVHDIIRNFELQDIEAYRLDHVNFKVGCAFPISLEEFEGNPFVRSWGTKLLPRRFPLFKFTALVNHAGTFREQHVWRKFLDETELGTHLIDEALERITGS